MRLTNRLLLLILWLAAALPVAAAPVLRQLSILVTLHDNGDADVQEVRQMSIDSEGTEGYIVMSNLAGSDIKNFSVSDETGRNYLNEGSWDTSRSRLQKAGRCGIVTKSDGYELCWGLGNSGDRIYHVNYTITKVVRSYKESDGFNWMFIARNMKPAAQKAELVIRTDKEEGLPEDTVKAWAFGFNGDVSLEDNEVHVVTTEPMTAEMAMIVMVEIPKGILHPSLREKESFKDMRDEAFENSDYKEPTWYQKFWNDFKADPEAIFGVLFFALLGIVSIWFKIRKRMERKKLLESVTWYREIPVNGDLVRARGLYDAFFSSGGISNEDMISAMILRLIRTGTLRIENRYVEPGSFKKMFGGEGKYQDCIVITDFNQQNRLINTVPMRKLYDMLRAASGDDLVLQPSELKNWMKHHETEVISFMNSISQSVSMKKAKQSIDDVRQVFGLKMFLNDFTLANERHLSELSLWNDYLVYAALFGIGDQVQADMKKVNPEYLKMGEITRNLTNKTLVPMLSSTTYNTAHSMKSAYDSRHSGGGGRSSFGGGGGSHGGGSGGGVR